MNLEDELIEEAKGFSVQHRNSDAASCLFRAADLIIERNGKLPQEFRRCSPCYELKMLANIELLKESNFDIDIINEIVNNLNKIINSGEDSRARHIWTPHIKYFKILKYCLTDSQVSTKHINDLCENSKISRYFAESLVHIFCQILSINYNDKNKIEKIDEVLQDIDKISNTPPEVTVFLRNLYQCLKKLKNSDYLSEEMYLSEFREVITEDQKDVYTLLGNEIYNKLSLAKNRPSKLKLFYKKYELCINITALILAIVSGVCAIITIIK